MAYTLFALSSIVVFVALASLLHLQFGRTGIVNFGIVGFVGLGMYGFGIMTAEYELPYLLALVLTLILTSVVALILGWIILNLDGESVLVATLAFATIVFNLSITQKDLTGGVTGLGIVPYPVDVGSSSGSAIALLGILTVVAVALLVYSALLGRAPYGRLLASVKDNEPLARSLGKATFIEKVIFFSVTSGLMGLVGALYASVNQFLVPRMLGPGLTFTVWIALVLGGRARVLGGVVGVLVTVGLFDLLIEPYLPVPAGFEQRMPDIKLMLYGLILVAVLMYRPAGLLGSRRRTAHE